jgi:hypothetical protein
MQYLPPFDMAVVLTGLLHERVKDNLDTLSTDELADLGVRLVDIARLIHEETHRREMEAANQS